MSSIISSISNLVQGLFQAVAGVLNSLLAAFQGLLSTFATLVASLGEIAKGLIQFVLANIVLIGVAFAAIVVWSAMQQRRGNLEGGSALKAKKQS